MFVKFKGVKILCLLIVPFLIIIFSLSVNWVQAGEITEINPNLGFDYFLLLEGQSVSAKTTQITPFDFHTIGLVSTGNIILTASLSIPTTAELTGFWWLSIIGTGGKFWYDFSFGFVPVSGPSVQVDVDDGLSFAFVIGSIFLTSPVSVEDPVTYSISVTGSP